MFVATPPLKRPPGLEPVPPLLSRLRDDMLAKDPVRRPPDIQTLRQRWDEALRPGANSQSFPPRKKREEGGSRGDRVPNWTAPAAVVVGSVPMAVEIVLLRFGKQSAGVSRDHVTSLAAGGVQVQEGEVGAPIPAQANLVVLDAGADVEGACALLPSLASDGRPLPIVCVHSDSDQLGRLVAAGAGDVVNYPVDGPGLLRKILKLEKRFRRRAKA